MNKLCDRCGQQIQEKRFAFHEVDQMDTKHTYGIFCFQCSIELLDELKGKLEWFHVENGWRGYIRPEARSAMEQAGLIHPRYNTQSIEIGQVGQIHQRVGRTEILEILGEMCRKMEDKRSSQDADKH